MISFACPDCGKGLKVRPDLAGKRGKCPHCKKPILVPGAAVPVSELRDAATIPPPSKPVAEKRPPRATDSASLVSLSGNDTENPQDSPGEDRSLIDFLAPPQGPNELGRLGNYRIMRVLGHGGMGVVYQAEDPHLQRQVAIKAMLPTLAVSASARERFVREARAAAAVEHDNIIAILQVGEDRGVPFLVMPLLKGESLAQRLREEGTLGLGEVLRIGRETAEGLAAAHARGLIHRDIKPANLWLEGERGRVKILDFGLARSARAESNLTQQGAILGTPTFMSPEQARGDTDHTTDLFSLGVILYYMATGTLPFRGSDPVAVLVAVATESPQPPSEVASGCPVELSDLVMALLEKRPADRPKSAAKVAAILQELESDLAAGRLQARTAKPAVRSRVAVVERTADKTDAIARRPRRRAKKKSSAVLWAAVGSSAAVVLLAVGMLLFRTKTPPQQDAAMQNQPPARQPGPNPVAPPPPNPAPAANVDARPPEAPANPAPPGPGNVRPVRRPPANPAPDNQARPFQEAGLPYSLAFSADGKQLAIGPLAQFVSVWDVASKQLIAKYPYVSRKRSGSCDNISFSHDGKRLVFNTQDGARVFDLTNGAEILATDPELPMSCMSFSPDGKSVVGGYLNDKRTRFWDVDAGKLVAETKGADPPTAFAWLPDGSHYVVGTMAGTIGIVNAMSGQTVRGFVAPQSRFIRAIAVSPDGSQIVVKGDASLPQVWDVKTGRSLAILKDDGVTPTNAIAYTADSRYILVGEFSGKIRMWNVGRFNWNSEFVGHWRPIRCLAVSPQSNLVASADESGIIQLWKPPPPPP